MKHGIVFFSLFLIIVADGSASQTPFLLDSAASFLRTIAVEIGPRPMGSPNERRAMEFALEKFRRFGLHEVYILPLRAASSYTAGGRVNTSSGTAVGIMKGKSQRIILLGAHIDSANPEIPGANDNASGSAVVIELARVLAQRLNESTIVFALFGGEEEGLQGSRHFVENFPLIDSVMLMIQVDMANGSEWLLPLIDSRQFTTPQWLVEAAYEELRALGYRGFSYPTHFMSFNSLFGFGAITSDHLPFLEHGIPALDFTSDVNEPIHTPQDSYDNFIIEGLKRSGDLVYRLVERFDGGVPSAPLQKYLLVDVAMNPIFIPTWLLGFIISISVIVALLALLRTRSKYPPHDRPVTPKWSSMKLFLFMLIIQTFVWVSENLVALIKGVRYPWIADTRGYLALGFIAGIIGIWVSLRLAKRLRLITDPYGYFLRAVVALLVMILLLGLLDLRGAIYPAVALLLLSIAMPVSNPLLRMLLWLMAPYMMYRLIFSEGFELMARTLALNPMRDRASGIVLHLIYILFFSVWAFPFLLSFAALYRDARSDLMWVRKFSGRRGLIAALSVFALLVAYLSIQPSYNDRWKPNLTIEYREDLTRAESSFLLNSTEYLRQISFRVNGFDTLLTGWSTRALINQPFSAEGHRLRVENNVELWGDSIKHVIIRSTIDFARQPYSVTLTYTSKRGTMTDFVSSWEVLASPRSATLRWFSYPDTSIQVLQTFKISGGDTVFQSIQAIFTDPGEETQLQGFEGNLFYRTTQTRESVIYKP